MLGLAAGLQKSSSALLSYVKDNLKLYLDFKSSKSDTLKFPCEGSTSFDGSDDYIEVGDTATLSGLSALTISTWALTNDTGADQVLFSKNTDADWDSKSEYGVQFGSQDIIFVVYDIDNDAYLGRATTGNEITAGQWHHIACTWDGSTTSAGIKIFIDGIQTDDADANSGSGFVTIRDTATPALIGARHNDLSASSKQRFWDGKIANVGIWSRELSLEEIQSIMRKNYSQLKGTETTSLVSWWALDDTNLTSELLTNHDFSDGTTGYSPNGFAGAGEGFSVSEGQATIIGDNLFSDFISVDTATALSLDNKKYQIVVDVESFTGTAWGLSHNGNVSIFGSRSLTTSGIHTYTFTWTAAYGLSTRLEANGTLVLNSVSIKEIQVEDLAGSNEGSITGATVTNSVYGGNAPVLDRAIDVAKEGQADAIGDGSASFNGSSDYINLGIPSIMPVGKMTCTFWAKIAANASDHILSNETATGYAGSIVVYTSSGDGKLSFRRGNADDTEWTSTTANDVSDNTWHHFACVDTGSTALDIYIDGIKDTVATAGSYSATAVASSINTLIGEDARTSGTSYFTGNLAQLGLWQGALTQAQIQEVMEQTYATMTPSIKSTLGAEIIGDPSFEDASYWSLSGGTGTADINTTSSGKLYCASATDWRLIKAGLLTSGKLYKIQYTFDSYTRGRVTSQMGTTDAITTSTGSDTITRYFVASGTSFDINVDSVASFTMTDISLKEVTNDLVGYWALDGDNSMDVVDFDGSSDYFDCGTGLCTSLGDAYDGGLSASIWFKADVTDDDDGLFQLSDFPTGNGEFYIKIDNDNILFKTRDGGVPSTVAFTNKTSWNHLVAVFDGPNNYQYLYLNGSLVDSDAQTNALTDLGGMKTMIGVYTNAGYPFNGKMAQVAVYDSALSASQVLAQYNLGVNGDYSSDDNLVGYWKMDNASTLTDLSSNSNNGTAAGSPTLVSDAVALDSTSNKNDGALN